MTKYSPHSIKAIAVMLAGRIVESGITINGGKPAIARLLRENFKDNPEMIVAFSKKSRGELLDALDRAIAHTRR